MVSEDVDPVDSVPMASSDPVAPRSRAAEDDFRVLAIIAAYNEGDIISSVVEHLIENGVEVYLIDNHSTDDTVEQARRWLGRGVVEIETFPPDADDGSHFDWGAILRRKEELAKTLGADWFIHHDADEIREAPWPGVRLRDAIRWVDVLGYNCIDFRVLNFPPIDDGFRKGMDPKAYFRYWQQPGEFDEIQIKAWKSGPAPIALAPWGGHQVRFRDRKVFPIQFLLRHYPIRSQSHGEQKVFAERKDRFLDRERVKGWHVQYDRYEPGHSFLGEPYHLKLFDKDEICLDLLLENPAARAAEARIRELENEVSSLSARGEILERRSLDADAFEREKHDLEQQSARLEGRILELQRVADRAESDAVELERKSRSLDAQRIDLENRLAQSRAQVGELSSALRGVEEENRKVAAELDAIRESTTWRLSAPFRRLLDALKG
jgi:glycosyltransferase involved in cell wall biosynthesis